MLLTRRLDLDTIRNNGRSVRISSKIDCHIEISGDLGWFEMVSILVNRDLDVAVFQIDDAVDRISKGQIAKTLRRGSH